MVFGKPQCVGKEVGVGRAKVGRGGARMARKHTMKQKHGGSRISDSSTEEIRDMSCGYVVGVTALLQACPAPMHANTLLCKNAFHLSRLLVNIEDGTPPSITQKEGILEHRDVSCGA